MALAVIDASVVVRWFLGEADSEAALRLRSDFFEGSLQVRVPSLLPYEVTNAVRFSGHFRSRELFEIAKDLDRSGFVAVPLFGDYLERTLQIALEAETTIYDASYLALAALESCPLYTADEHQLERADDEIQVIHIRDYRLEP